MAAQGVFWGEGEEHTNIKYLVSQNHINTSIANFHVQTKEKNGKCSLMYLCDAILSTLHLRNIHTNLYTIQKYYG